MYLKLYIILNVLKGIKKSIQFFVNSVTGGHIINNIVFIPYQMSISTHLCTHYVKGKHHIIKYVINILQTTVWHWENIRMYLKINPLDVFFIYSLYQYTVSLLSLISNVKTAHAHERFCESFFPSNPRWLCNVVV